MTTVATGMLGGRTTTCKRVLHHNKAVIICKDKIITNPSEGRNHSLKKKPCMQSLMLASSLSQTDALDFKGAE
jgi:hypothetical protein